MLLTTFGREVFTKDPTALLRDHGLEERTIQERARGQAAYQAAREAGASPADALEAYTSPRTGDPASAHLSARALGAWATFYETVRTLDLDELPLEERAQARELVKTAALFQRLFKESPPEKLS